MAEAHTGTLSGAKPGADEMAVMAKGPVANPNSEITFPTDSATVGETTPVIPQAVKLSVHHSLRALPRTQ